MLPTRAVADAKLDCHTGSAANECLRPRDHSLP